MQIYLILMLSLFSQIFCGPPKPDSNIDTSVQMRSLQEILKDLKSENWNTRSLAIAEITTNRYKEAVIEVRKFLNDPSPIVQSTAAICLGEFQDTTSLEKILELFSVKEIPKENLLDALKRMKDPRGAKAILPFLNSEDPTLRLLAVDALQEINFRSIGQEILKMAKQNKDPQKDKTYAMILGKLEVKEAEDYLIQVAQREKESPTLAAALLALGRIKSKKSIPILTKALAENFPKGRENASLSLKAIKEKTSLPFLYPYLKSSDLELRYLTVEILSEIPDPQTTKVIEEILSANDKNFYGAACLLAGQLQLKNLRPRIETILQDSTTPERESIAQALGWMKDKSSIPVLLKVLEEKSGEGRYGAAWSLGILEAKEALDALLKAANSSDQKLANLAIESIGHLKMEESIPFLEKILEKDKNKSLFILSSISVIPTSKASQVLLKYAKSQDPILYKPAIEFLGQRKDKTTVKPLVEILKQNEGDKNKILVSALNSITGKKIPTAAEWLAQPLE